MQIGQLVAIGAVIALCACGDTSGDGSTGKKKTASGPIAANEMTIDTLVGGTFRGRAGQAWTRGKVRVV